MHDPLMKTQREWVNYCQKELRLQVKGLRSVCDIERITSYLFSLTMRLGISNASM